MRNSLFALTLATLAASCQTPSTPLKPNRTATPSALSQADFRASYEHLSDEQFSSKWKASLESPLLFFRSYVNTWYQEVNSRPDRGPTGPCFGDAHPENFGYIWFGEDDFRYLFNDLDDSGLCPVAYDALRYFTALRLYWDRPELEEEVLQTYLEVLDNLGAEAVPSSIKKHKPTLQGLRSKIAEKYLSGDKIKKSDIVKSLPQTEQDKVFKATLQALPNDKSQTLMRDAAQVEIKGGGSGGLDRYSILIRDERGQNQLIELKQLVQPATEFGKSEAKKKLPRPLFMGLTWDYETPPYFAFTKLDDKDFLLRSRAKDDLELKDLTEAERLQVFRYQAMLLAKVHRLTLGNARELGDWLREEIGLMSERYRTAYDHARAQARAR